MAGKKKLTLSVDEDVVERAKTLARRWNTSVSALVEERLRGLTEPSSVDDTPLVARLRGVLPEEASRDEHRRHLEEKHSR
jgi:hypothetical protein